MNEERHPGGGLRDVAPPRPRHSTARAGSSPRPISRATARTCRAWFKPDLPTGMNDMGASYSWAEPEQYFRWVREERNWMFMMESGSASLPPISSLSQFLPDVERARAGASARSRSTPPGPTTAPTTTSRATTAPCAGCTANPRAWPTTAGKATSSRPTSTARCSRRSTTGCGTSPAASPSGRSTPAAERAVADLRLVSQADGQLVLHQEGLRAAARAVEPARTAPSASSTRRLAPQPGLEVRARVFDLNARLLWEKTAPGRARRPTPTAKLHRSRSRRGATPVYFVKLELTRRARPAGVGQLLLAARAGRRRPSRRCNRFRP